MSQTTVAVTPGSGATVSVDSISSVLYQNVKLVDGTTGGTTPAVVNADGSLKVSASGGPATYFAMYKAASAGTSATTNVLTFAGSATKTVKVTRIVLSSTTATAAAYYDVLVNRQSAADTGGTAATTATIVKAVSASGTATAVAPLFYTAGPTAGTLVGTISAHKYFSALTGTPAPVTQLDIRFGMSGEQPLTLVGVAEVVAVTLNGATPANAQSWDAFVVWTEE